MEYFNQGVEYITHPEIYGRHIPTAEEIEMIQGQHPAVFDPPTDISKYGNGELFSEELNSILIWIAEFIGMTKPG